MVWKPHVTVAAIIPDKQERFLMVEEISNGHVVINQPAGHLEPDESLIEAAIRETLEETGWCFQPEAVSGIYHWTSPTDGKTFLRVCFIGSVSDHDPERPLDDGILRACWMTRNELRQACLRSPMVMRGVDDFLQGHRYPLSLLTSLES